MLKNGFTFIELICILALMGISASMVYPRVETMTKSIEIKSAADQMINDLRYAKMYAVSNQNTMVYVLFLKDDKTKDYCGYLIYYPGNISSMSLKRVYLPKGIYVSKDESTFKDNQIGFRGNGSVSPPCTIKLIDKNTGISKKITLTIGYTRIMIKE